MNIHMSQEHGPVSILVIIYATYNNKCTHDQEPYIYIVDDRRDY